MTTLAQISTELFQHNILQDILYICLIAFGLAILFYHLTRHIHAPIPPSPRFKVTTAHFTPYDILGVLAIIGIFAATILLPYKSAEPALKEHSNLTILIAFSIPSLFALGVLITIGLRTSLNDALGLLPAKPLHVLIGSLIAFIIMIIIMIIAGMFGLDEWLKSRIGEPKPQEVVTEVINTTDNVRLFILIFSACVIAPIVEEIIFRGYLYPVTKRFTDPYFAAVFTGVIFGCIHGNVGAVILLSALGILLAALYEATGSILACIATHAIFNSFSVFLMRHPEIFDKAV